MVRLAVVTTGATFNRADWRLKRVTAHLASFGGEVVALSSPARGLNPGQLSIAEQMYTWVLWGLHCSKTPITTRSFRRRLDVVERTTNNVFDVWRSAAGWLVFDKLDRSQPGRPAVIYKPTVAGIDAMQQWAIGALRIGYVTAKFARQTDASAAAVGLRTEPGVVVPSYVRRAGPVPREISAAILVVAWVLWQSGEGVNAPAIAQRLGVDDSSVRRGFAELVEQKLVEPTGTGVVRVGRRGPHAMHYRLTQTGAAYAPRYLATLLG